MTPSDHALLSASGAHRWLNCTPSAVLESGEPDSSSAAAEQGTVAHALAEHKLRRALKQRSTRPTSQWIDDEMEQLTDDYVTYVLEQVSEAKESCPDAQVLIEQRLDFSHVVPDGFGTGDCVIIAEPCLQIIDLKYGQGVLVEAERHPQLMLYALGALHAFGDLYDIEQVAVTIFQPRRSNVDMWETSVSDLLAWAETAEKPRAERRRANRSHMCSPGWEKTRGLPPIIYMRISELAGVGQAGNHGGKLVEALSKPSAATYTSRECTPWTMLSTRP